jgi:hypothetical protein
VVICSQLPDNHNTSITNMVEYLAAEVIQQRDLPTPFTWIEHNPEHKGEIGEYLLVRFAGWKPVERCLRGVVKLGASDQALFTHLPSCRF